MNCAPSPLLLDALSCLLCRGSLSWTPLQGGTGTLRCARCSVRIPVLEGFPLFGERDLDKETSDAAWLASLEARLLGDPLDYERFLLARAERGIRDRYAAFRNFNESSRTVLAFLDLIREALRPGDLILDTWNRTGWTGELLAGLFPQQHVISLWEGDRDTLGYRGFRHWQGPGRRPANLEVVFVDLQREPLPFRDGCFAFVHGLDTLHRYPIHTLVPELLRVCRPNAPLLFPHVHLTNAEPEPFFERGERQLHGSDWQQRLERVLEGDPRRPIVVGEQSLFASQRSASGPGVLESDPDTDDYNALIGIVPEAWLGQPLAAEPGVPEPGELTGFVREGGDRRVRDDTMGAGVAQAWTGIRNPLLRVDLGDGAVEVHDPQSILERHPVYAERLRAEAPGRLAKPLERRLHYWLPRLPTLGAIAERLGVGLDALQPVLARLQRQELLTVRQVGRGCATLQRYQAELELAPLADADDLPALWRRAVRLYGERTFLVDDQDGSSFTYAQADAVVQALAHRLKAARLKAGDQVVVWAEVHVEAILCFWAAALLGVVVVPLDPDLDTQAAQRVLGALDPKLLLVDLPRVQAAAQLAPRAAQVVFDADSEHAGVAFFADWLTDRDFELGPYSSCDASLATLPAIVLFTSGTTGAPRGVVLEQRALASSARLVAQTFAWTERDVYLGLGELHVMSGFRNTCLAVAHAGAAAVVTSADVRRTPQGVLECVVRRSVTVLGCVPAALRTLTAAAGRGRRPRSLRLVLSTAAPLTESVRAGFEQAFGVPVVDYYGLTETAGLCAVEPARGVGDPAPAVLRPVDALFRLVGAQQDAPPKPERVTNTKKHPSESMSRSRNPRAETSSAPTGERAPTSDPRASASVAPGEVGELWVHSANLMRGYLDDPAGTRAAFVDGWFRTGDLACRQPDGTYRLVGRARDVFKNAHGELVATAEVEEALLAHPSVRDAGLLVVTDEAGERLEAYVVPQAHAEFSVEGWLAQLHEHLTATLGAKKVPTRLIHTAELPRNVNGKLVRDRLSVERSS